MRKLTPAAVINDVLGEVPVPVPGARTRDEEDEVVWK